MKKAIAIFLFLITMSHDALSGSFTGIWWNRTESGWGLNFAQQGNSVFATMYVYDRSGRPTWYLATMNAAPNAPAQFTGDMYEVSGPFYGNFFNPAAVASRLVGTMSFNGSAGIRGSLNYNVDGFAVSKSIEPFSFAPVPVNGTYAITILRAPSNNCVIPALETSAPTRAVLSANSFQLLNSTGVAACTVGGTFAQFGSQSSFVGNQPSCLSPSNSGDSLVLLDIDPHGITGVVNSALYISTTAVFSNAARTCNSVFYIAGVRLN